MSKTFAELDIPFPLFDAPAKESSDYRGLDACTICARKEVHCFMVDALVVQCQHCGADLATGTESNYCRSCGKVADLPEVPSDGTLGCYACLRAGRAAITKDTELGMVIWEQAVEGLTHGVPGLERDDFELVVSEDDPEWMRAKVPCDLLFELIRTPTYSTWQGERWLFCCQKPMIYIGEWKEIEFEKHAQGGDGKLLLAQVNIRGLDADFWGQLDHIGGPYMFHCPVCQKRDGHFDFD